MNSQRARDREKEEMNKEELLKAFADSGRLQIIGVSIEPKREEKENGNH